MDDSRLTALRIILGKDSFSFNNKKVVYVPPLANLLFEAELFYHELYSDNKFDGYISKAEAERILLVKGFVTPEEKKEFEDMPETIKEAKKNLYRAWTTGLKHKVNMERKMLELLHKRFTKLWTAFHSIDDIILDVFVRNETDRYALVRSIYVDGSPIDYDNPNMDLLAKVRSRFISKEMYDRAVRNSDLQFYVENGYFKGKDLNDEQITAISMIKSLVSVMNHSEAPPKEVLDDSDLLEGWIHCLKEDNEIRKKKQEIDDKVDAKGAQQGVFVPVKNEQEAKQVHKMNGAMGKILAKNIIDRKK